MKRLSIALALLVWLPVVPLVAQMGKAHPPVTEVTFSRGMCFGSCPAYDLTLRSDGTAIYKGIRYASRTGTYVGHFWSGDFNRLIVAADRLGFWKMKARYTVPITDQPTQTLTFKFSKGETVISEYGSSGPNELWELQTLVDGIAANVSDWKKTKAS